MPFFTRTLLPFLCLVSGIGLLPSPSNAEPAKFIDRFTEEIYPLLTNEAQGESCVSCHDSSATSDLVFLGQPKADFLTLWQQGYLALDTPDSLLGRITSTAAKRRMPKKQAAWPKGSVATLRQFLSDMAEGEMATQARDETFPQALLEPFEGEVPSEMDNQFISYRQLRAKVERIFGRSWQRGTRDLFAENVAMFGGADFQTRFNESTQPSSNFLTALDMMSREMVERAFNENSGPFAQRDADWERELTRLYRAFLYRPPTAAEKEEAHALFRRLETAQASVMKRPYDLAFELTVSDPATGERRSEEVRVPVHSTTGGAHQFWVDQSQGDSLTLPFTLHLPPDATAQPHFRLSNVHSVDNVSFAGLTLQQETQPNLTVDIPASHTAVSALGAWTRQEKQDRLSYEDEGREKGHSHIDVPLALPEPGDYTLTLHWRESASNATRVFVEITTPEPSERVLATPPAEPLPPKGEAHFHYDSSEDSRPFFEPPASFVFHEDDHHGVRVSNLGTDDLVTAGALEFHSLDDETHFQIDSREAEGQEGWINFKSRSFGAYNQKGTSVSDDEKKDEERYLHYRPRTKREEGWQPDHPYRLRLYYPGKRGHETRVPFTVHAATSSPILRVSHPPHAHLGATLVIDASGTHTVQQEPLHYHWSQIGGPAADFVPTDSTLKFTVPSWTVDAAAWQAVARALMRHPDFLFTRPPSMATLSHGPARDRLQLVKLAQDLVGRPPTAEEFAQLEEGQSLPLLADHYLQSKAFEDFYFHRIRLYLESQGTEVQDEPARVWSYVAFNDLPFQEILTADYTIGPDWTRQERPEHYGRTGVLTTKGFIQGKPGLPHYNYAAQVSMLFLGYVYEVPPEIVEQREGITAAGTTDPQSTCYSCHKVLTPLAHQRNRWTDDGDYRTHTESGLEIDASDHGLVDEYPFKGNGLEAFATQAVKKERFIRTIIDTHFSFYFGRQMRFREDERSLYRHVWDAVHADGFKIRTLIRSLVTSPEYLAPSPSTSTPLSFHE